LNVPMVAMNSLLFVLEVTLCDLSMARFGQA
jgi:hypothetical protein